MLLIERIFNLIAFLDACAMWRQTVVVIPSDQIKGATVRQALTEAHCGKHHAAPCSILSEEEGCQWSLFYAKLD